MNIKKQHRISLKDIAVELGVSIATVSRALRDSPEIGKEMQIIPLLRVCVKKPQRLLA